jgi:hypothetical protein
MPSSFTEPKHALQFLVSEARGHRSRRQIKVLAGSGAERPLTAGMVLGKRLSGTAAATAFGANTGNGVMGAITVTGPAKPGRHQLVVVEPGSNVGTFLVFGPDGILIGRGAVASAFSAGGLAFTLADGATDFVSGDGFFIDITQTDEKWLQYDPAGTLGEQVAAGILIQDVTAADGSDNPNGAAIVRDCEVASGEITWPNGISAANQAIATRALEALGIIFRS